MYAQKRRFLSSFAHKILYLLTFLLGTGTLFIYAYNYYHQVDPETWFSFWKYCMTGLFLIALPIVMWFIIGGLIDLKKLFTLLNQEILDETDDGLVRNKPQQNIPNKPQQNP